MLFVWLIYDSSACKVFPLPPLQLLKHFESVSLLWTAYFIVTEKSNYLHNKLKYQIKRNFREQFSSFFYFYNSYCKEPFQQRKTKIMILCSLIYNISRIVQGNTCLAILALTRQPADILTSSFGDTPKFEEAEKLDKRNMIADQIKMMKQQMKKASIPRQHYGQPTSSRQNRRSRR